MRRHTALATAAVLTIWSATACAGLGRSMGSNTASFNVAPDSVARTAVMVLNGRGYQTMHMGEGLVLTSPRDVPDSMRAGDNVREATTRYFVQVRAARAPYSGETGMTVTGYYVPMRAMADSASRPNADGTVTPGAGQRAIAVTARSPLYNEVTALAEAIRTAARTGQ